MGFAMHCSKEKLPITNWVKKTKVRDITIVINIMNIIIGIINDIIHLLNHHHYHHHHHHQETRKAVTRQRWQCSLKPAGRRHWLQSKKRSTKFTSADCATRRALQDMDWRCTRIRYIQRKGVLKKQIDLENEKLIPLSADWQTNKQETRFEPLLDSW